MKTKILFAAFAVIITGVVTMTKANVESKAISKTVQVKAAPENPTMDTGWTFVTSDFIYTHD